MNENRIFRPIPTCEIPPPVLEQPIPGTGSRHGIPRILLQSVGTERAARRILLLGGLFVLLSGAELVLLLRLPSPELLVVYRDYPRKTLVEEGR